MAKKKKEKIPFHIKHDYKQYSYEDGGLTITYWAKDDVAAELYKKKVKGKQMFEFIVVCILIFIAVKLYDIDNNRPPKF